MFSILSTDDSMSVISWIRLMIAAQISLNLNINILFQIKLEIIKLKQTDILMAE